MLKLSFLIILSFFTLSIFAQTRTFSGKVCDFSTKKPVAEAVIRYHNQVFYSNKEGAFKFEIGSGAVEISFKHLSYKTLVIVIPKDSVLKKDIYLIPHENLLDQVQVNRSRNVARLNNYELITHSDLGKKPGLFANPDLLNEIKTLPGVTNGGEGNSGLYIRGGSSGQNLVLFNHATIYNPSHLLGFFSVFNTSAVNEAKVYKSGIPAEYAGRLAAVVDVSSDKSIADTLSGSAAVSFLAADAHLSVPLTKQWTVKTSLRKTFMNYSIWPIVNSFSKERTSLNNLAYDFYDVNFSSSLQLDTQNNVFATFYTGGDRFGFELGRFGIANAVDWRNRVGSVEWKTEPFKNSTLNATAAYSDYRFNFALDQDGANARINSAIRDFDLQSTLGLTLKKQHIKLGIAYTSHRFVPNTPDVVTGNVKLDFGAANVYHSSETALFFSDKFDLGQYFGFLLGSRFTYYHVVKQVDDKINEPDFNTLFWEPSFNVQYKLNGATDIKLSFSRNIQTAHLIPVAASNFPVDFWMPSTNKLVPQKGIQLSLGLFKNWGNAFEGYVDFYYKRMNHIIEFNGGLSNLLDNLQIEENAFSGKGHVLGAEFFLKKNIGKITGTLGYTISRNRRSFPDINNGAEFPFRYDRTHELNLSANYPISKKWNLSSFFTYSTGNAYTAPVGRYIVAGSIINEYGAFNGTRMPAYHRLDVAATYQFQKRKNCISELSFSVYNVYNRKNPIFDYFQFSGDLKSSVSIQKKSIALLPVLPAVAYKISF